MTEYFDVVDENDRIIGRASRDECHKKGLIHRAIYIIVINSKKEILLQKRSMKKDLHPGLWTTSVSGHVDSGESYEEAAHREMKEEIGATGKLSEILAFSFKDISIKDRCDYEMKKIFSTKNEGPFKPDKEELDKVEFFSCKKIVEMMANGIVTPPSVEVMKRILQSQKLLRKLGLE